MTRLTVRLSRVEGNLLRRRPQASSIRLFLDDELEPCGEHVRCYVEPETKNHHAGVIRLSFKTPDIPARSTR